PDPRDQVRLLLEMSRVDIDKIAPGSQVQVFEPVWKQNPGNLLLGVAVGLALVHDSQSEKGIEVLRTVLQQHPDSAQAWDGWLTGLDDGFQPDLLRREFARLPQALGTDPRFAKHEGAVAQSARDWPRAIAAYDRAHAFEPFRRRSKITSAIHRKLAKNACFSGVLASVVPASLLKLFLSAALVGPWGGKPVSSTGAFSYSASQVTEASGVVRITAQKSGNGWVGGILSTDTTRTFQIWLCGSACQAARRARFLASHLDLPEASNSAGSASAAKAVTVTAPPAPT